MLKKGFTLIELLAVIIVLAMVLAIAVPAISSIINNTRTNTYKSQQGLLKKAAMTYLGNNSTLYPTNIGGSTVVKLSDLISNNYISDILDPKDRSICDVSNSIVKVTNVAGGTPLFEPYLQCTNYKADESSPGIDTSVSGNQLTVKGIEGKYLSFDGANNYGYIAREVLTNFRTFEFTIFTRELLTYGSASWPLTQVIHLNGANTLNTEFGVHNISGNRLLIGFGAEGLTNYITYSNYQLFTRYNVVYVMDDTAGNLYVNGSLVGTAANMGYNTIGNFTTTSSTPLTLAAHTAPSCVGCDYYKMDLENLRVYQRALSASEIATNYQNNTITDSTGLIANYNFNEAENNAVNNKVSSNYNVTLVGPTVFSNSGIKEIRIKQGSTLINSSNQSNAVFTVASGTYTIEVEDNVGRITTKTVTI